MSPSRMAMSRGPAVLDHLDDDVPFDLEEQLLAVLDVVVLPRVRAADDHHLELGVLPDHLVADGRLQEVAVLVDPALEIDRGHQSHEDSRWSKWGSSRSGSYWRALR